MFSDSPSQECKENENGEIECDWSYKWLQFRVTIRRDGIDIGPSFRSQLKVLTNRRPFSSLLIIHQLL